MPILRIWKSNLERARDRANLTPEEREQVEAWLADKTGEISLEVDTMPQPMARALLDDGKIKANERAVLALRVLGMKADRLTNERLYNTSASGPIEFASILLAANTSQPNAELRWNNRWYPVIVIAEIGEEDKVAKYVSAVVRLGVGQQVMTYSLPVNPAWFSAPDGSSRDLSIIEVLTLLGFRKLQIEPSKFNLRLVNCERLAAQAGRQVLVRGSVLELGRAWYGSMLAEVPLGSEETPRRAVVEPVLRDDSDHSDFFPGRHHNAFDERVSRLPLVRLFSLENKKYVYADIDDLAEYEYDADAIERLILPSDMKDVLESVFRASKQELFGDHVRGKHGGIVILACGHPGVGKTLTAEVYAELTQRPLYVLEFGELGTTVQAIEQSLSTVFGRVVKWRAVLQFDECEVFLAKRGEDLERSAIVGIFLRMLDYYEGLLFLTTNRPDVLDHAVHSRVMLRLDYPDLTTETRLDVWRTILTSAGLSMSDNDLHLLASEPLNGRQIRNRVRLARILHGAGAISAAQMTTLARFSSIAQH